MMATSVDYDRHALDIENFSFIPVLSFDLLASSEWTDNLVWHLGQSHVVRAFGHGPGPSWP